MISVGLLMWGPTIDLDAEGNGLGSCVSSIISVWWFSVEISYWKASWLSLKNLDLSVPLPLEGLFSLYVWDRYVCVFSPLALGTPNPSPLITSESLRRRVGFVVQCYRLKAQFVLGKYLKESERWRIQFMQVISLNNSSQGVASTVHQIHSGFQCKF